MDAARVDDTLEVDEAKAVLAAAAADDELVPSGGWRSATGYGSAN